MLFALGWRPYAHDQAVKRLRRQLKASDISKIVARRRVDMMRTVKLSLAVTSVGAALLVASPMASGAAWNADTVRIDASTGHIFRPNGHMVDDPCKHRRIELKAGTYSWRVFDVHLKHRNRPNRGRNRNIYLNKGPYMWTDCLEHREFLGNNVHRSTLTELETGGTARAKSNFMNLAFGSGPYEYGSRLQWLRKRR
jgi:hypothetical protein